MVSYLVDLFLAVMLITTSVYMVVISRRLRVLRAGQSEINGLLDQFTRSIEATDASVKRLTGSAVEIAGRLGDSVDRGKALQEEVTLLLASCERAATRLETSVQHARRLLRQLDDGIAARAMAPQSDAEPVPAHRGAADSEAEDDAGDDAQDDKGADGHAVFRLLAPADLAVGPLRGPDGNRKAVGDFYAALRTVKGKA
jgi:hypothetical protein